eukprot:SM000053S17431  [mRNA]  locus=s53:385712:386563:+ [translate_table: standard]
MAASGALSKIGTALLLVLGLLSQCASLTASAASGPHPVASSASKSDSIAGAFAIGLASYAQPLAAEGLKLGQYFRWEGPDNSTQEPAGAGGLEEKWLDFGSSGNGSGGSSGGGGGKRAGGWRAGWRQRQSRHTGREGGCCRLSARLARHGPCGGGNGIHKRRGGCTTAGGC